MMTSLITDKKNIQNHLNLETVTFSDHSNTKSIKILLCTNKTTINTKQKKQTSVTAKNIFNYYYI